MAVIVEVLAVVIVATDIICDFIFKDFRYKNILIYYCRAYVTGGVGKTVAAIGFQKEKESCEIKRLWIKDPIPR